MCKTSLSVQSPYKDKVAQSIARNKLAHDDIMSADWYDAVDVMAFDTILSV
jgi:hypothetical protein